MKTLLVEDNGGDVNLFQFALKALPGTLEVFVADDGVKAMEFLRREGKHASAPRPDFVIVDLKLPRKSGLEVLSDMKRDPDLRRIPVIVLTSSKAPGDVARAYDLQATAYFVKPVTGFDDVVDAIVRFMKSAELPGNGAHMPAAGRQAGGEPSAVYPVLPPSEGNFEEWPLEKKLSAIVESSPSAMIMVDQEGRILLVNAEIERLFGYRREEIVGKSIEILVPGRFRGQHPGQRAGLLARPEKRPMGAGRDLVGLRKDGTEVPIEIGLTPIRTAQGTLVLSAIVDITERKRNEAILAQQTRELERSNAELEQFAYVASHDLQEPLRTVASYTQLLDRRYGDRLEPEAKTYIEFARAGALRMQSLIEALLAYSRAGARAREIDPADCGAALDAALANLKLSIQESGAQIERGELPTIAGDSTQLVELFQNLVGNALKFRGAERPRVTIAARRAGSEWVVSVKDNGIGIAPEYFDRIFQVFQRLHGIDAYPGTGIGLAICKRIVERMGGRIWVESAPGKGSTFFFSAPDAPAAGRRPVDSNPPGV